MESGNQACGSARSAHSCGPAPGPAAPPLPPAQVTGDTHLQKLTCPLHWPVPSQDPGRTRSHICPGLGLTCQMGKCTRDVTTGACTYHLPRGCPARPPQHWEGLAWALASPGSGWVRALCWHCGRWHWARMDLWLLQLRSCFQPAMGLVFPHESL